MNVVVSSEESEGKAIIAVHNALDPFINMLTVATIVEKQ
jgi:hypothetical protein